MPELPEVSIIMPTGARVERASLIRRALASALTQRAVRVVPIVVVNGPHRDDDLVQTLRRDRRLRLVELDEPSLPAALRRGREAVDTAWFSALDDDDEYLPDALAARVRALSVRPDRDTVISSGIVRNLNSEHVYPRDLSAVERAPLSALTRGNWLLPGAWLCRSDRVGAWLFDGMPRYLECTFLALQFTLHCRPLFLDQPGVVWNRSTPVSESKSREYLQGQVPAIEQMLELPLPEETRRWLLRVMAGARHGIASMHLHDQALPQAWRWHARCLLGSGGLRYLSFTARLLIESVRS